MFKVVFHKFSLPVTLLPGAKTFHENLFLFMLCSEIIFLYLVSWFLNAPARSKTRSVFPLAALTQSAINLNFTDRAVFYFFVLWLLRSAQQGVFSAKQ